MGDVISLGVILSALLDLKILRAQMTLNESSLCQVVPWPVPSAMPPFHNTEKEGTLMTLIFSSLGPQASLNQKYDAFPLNDLRPSDPRPQVLRSYYTTMVF